MPPDLSADRELAVPEPPREMRRPRRNAAAPYLAESGAFPSSFT